MHFELTDKQIAEMRIQDGYDLVDFRPFRKGDWVGCPDTNGLLWAQKAMYDGHSFQPAFILRAREGVWAWSHKVKVADVYKAEEILMPEDVGEIVAFRPVLQGEMYLDPYTYSSCAGMTYAVQTAGSTIAQPRLIVKKSYAQTS